MEGLNDGLQYQLLSHTFASFRQLVDKVLVVENKRRQMEEKKRKFQGQQSGNNSRFRANPQQAQPQQRYQGQTGPNRNHQQQQQYKAPAQCQQQPNNVPVRNNVRNAP